MKQSVAHKKWDALITTMVLTLTGAMLAVLHFVLGILPFNNVIETLLYTGFGYCFGKKVQGNNLWWGIVLALPALLLTIYRIIYAQGFSVGVDLWINLLLLPFASCLGMYLRIRYHHHKHSLLDEHFLND